MATGLDELSASAEGARDGSGNELRTVGEGPGSALAARYRAEAMPASTRAAYGADWARFTAWCHRTGHPALPASPRVVGDYLAEAAALIDETARAVYAPATLARWVAGINAAHRAAGHPAPGADPLVAATLRGIRATRRTPPRRAKPLRLEQLSIILARIDRAHWPAAVKGRRDTALLLLGFAGALRRSELAALTLTDLEIDDGALITRIRASKTDQDAAGATIACPRGTHRATCTACALLDWALLLDVDTAAARPGVLALLHQDKKRRPQTHRCTDPDALQTWTHLQKNHGGEPVFRPVTKAATIGARAISGAAVADVVQARLTAAGLDPTGFSGHSLRAGFVTDAFTAGATAHEIMRQTRHAAPATLEAYARHYTPLEANAVTRLGL